MKKIYDKFLSSLSEKNNKKTISIMNDFFNEIDRLILIEKYSLKDTAANSPYTNFIQEDKFSIQLFKDELIIFKMNTDFDKKHTFETLLSIDKNNNYNLSFNINNTKKELTIFCLNFNDKNSYSFIAENVNIKSTILKKDDRSKNIMNLILENFSKNSEIKDLLLINYDIVIEDDEVLFNIYKHGIILNNSQKDTQMRLKSNN